jgi:hypothetical protein
LAKPLEWYVTEIQGKKKKEAGGQRERERETGWTSEARGGVWCQKSQEPQVWFGEQEDDDGGGKAGNKEVQQAK